MNFPIGHLRQRLLDRYLEAVEEGLLAWAGLIGKEADAGKMPKMPGVALLLSAGGFSPPHGVGGPQRQMAIIEWTAFAGGQDHRGTGKSGYAGARGGDYALEMTMQIAEGFEMRASDDAPGFPIWIDRFALWAMDQPAGKFVYEVALRHEWNFVEEGFDE